MLYSGTMAAIVLGGASTIGGVGLGYKYGISGMWLVVAIGVGMLALSLLFAGRIQRLRVYTVSQMLELRYGPGSSRAVRPRHVGLHAHAVGHLDHRLRDDLRRAVRHRQGARPSSWAAASWSSTPRSAACGRSR